MVDLELLEDELSQPTAGLVAAMGRLDGGLLVLGAGAKMGPSLCRMAVRASQEAGAARSVWAASRFGDSGLRERLESVGVPTIALDLLQDGALTTLPEAANVVLMAGHKFGSSDDPEATWATNVLLPSLVARRFSSSRLVTLATGNVYPLSKVTAGGSTEDDPVGPIGEYAQSALGRERVLTYMSKTHDTPMALIRLNYAVEPRYGVLRDIADKVLAGDPLDLTMGHVNVIWQRDANAVVLQTLLHCAVPPFVLNVTGPEVVSVRAVARAFGQMFGVEPVFEGGESDHALLSNATRCQEMLGLPPVALPEMIERVGQWVMNGGSTLGKPTKYQQREGRF